MEAIQEEKDPEVQVKKIEFICPNWPDGNIVLEFEENEPDVDRFYMKEAEPYHIWVTFKVFNDIVIGLKFCNVVKKLGMVVEKSE